MWKTWEAFRGKGPKVRLGGSLSGGGIFWRSMSFLGTGESELDLLIVVVLLFGESDIASKQAVKFRRQF